MKDNTIKLEEKLKEFNLKLMNNPIEEQRSEPIIVFDFIFPDGNSGTLVGYNRGIGPMGWDMEDWEMPVGVYTDTGDYYSFVFDTCEPELEKKPTFRIGDRNYYYRILGCYTMCAKVDPKTGILIN